MAKKEKTFILLDSSVTTYGFRIVPEGVDLEHFKKNPVMLYDHSDWRMPIGRWENIRLEEGKIKAEAVFDYDDPNEDVQRVIGKVERGFIKAASVSLRDNIVSSDTALQIEGQTLPTIIKSRLREASIVSIGGNHNAIRLYDNDDEEIDLSDEIKLSDLFKPKKIEKTMNEELLKLLNLSDKADDDAVLIAVKALHKEKVELADKLEKLAEEDKKIKETEAIKLVDEAVRSGKINEKDDKSVSKKWLELFDRDFAGTKILLESLPARQSVSQQIDQASGKSKVELTDLETKSWDELDRAGKLIMLKDSYPDLYKEKYKDKFGVDPKL